MSHHLRRRGRVGLMSSSVESSIVATLSSVMIALLVGLLIVALGVSGTWFALFGGNHAKVLASNGSRLIEDSADPEPRPRRDRPRRVAETVRRADYDPSPTVRPGLARRLGSALMLIVVTLGIALTIGAVISAVVVVAVAVVS